MPARVIPLETIRVASPCEKSWDEMSGDAQRRFCDHCGKHVHNLSAMTRSEAEKLICESAGSLCVRYAMTQTGQVQTLEYQPAAPLLHRRRMWFAFGIFGALAASAVQLFGFTRTKPPPAVPMVMGEIAPPIPAVMQGKVALPSPPTTVPSAPSSSDAANGPS
jgi:hypothetical protein